MVSRPAHVVRLAAALAAALAAGLGLAGCSTLRGAAPGCTSVSRLAIVAQSVPGASYIPCIARLPEGWTASAFQPSTGKTRFALTSDRAAGHSVRVSLASVCDVAGATPTTPRGEGVRTYIRLRSITPRYAGTLFDAFAGGCITYQFDFPRGPHIGLMEDFQGAVALVSRQQLRLDLRHQLGLELDQ
jgi:hypothetical protein